MPYNPKLSPCPQEAMEGIAKILSVHSHLLSYNPKPSPCPQEAMESIDNILTVSTLIYCPTTPNLLPVPGSHGEYRQHSNSVHSHLLPYNPKLSPCPQEAMESIDKILSVHSNLLPYNPKPSPCRQEAMESIDNILTVSTLIYCPTTPNLLPVPRKTWRV